MTYGNIWKTLSKINCNDKIEKKGGLSYLPWAWAWGILMEHYPDATYEFGEEHYFSDSTCEVICTVTIGECSRRMTLPVMDHRNNSIVNPSSRQVSDSRLRCLVKCLAMFGLGHYIYALGHHIYTGEDLSRDTISDEQAKMLSAKIASIPSTSVEKVCAAYGITRLEDMPSKEFQRCNTLLDCKRGES